MTGRIRCYLPAAKRGIVQTEAGEELAFSLSNGSGILDLNGGDLVEFDAASEGRKLATNIRLVRRWAEMLNEQHRPLVNQFHATVQIVA